MSRVFSFPSFLAVELKVNYRTIGMEEIKLSLTHEPRRAAPAPERGCIFEDWSFVWSRSAKRRVAPQFA
jgi:hypothetical protein